MTVAHIHLGPHKTGSTALQLYLRNKEDFLGENDISFLSQHSRSRSQYLEWRAVFSRVVNRVSVGEMKDEDSFEALSNQFRSLMPILGQHSSLVFSDENIMGRPVGHFYGRYEASRRVDSYYPAFRLILASFECALSQKFDQVLFYLVKRDWLDQARSLYKDFFRKYYHVACIPEDKFLLFLEDCGAPETYNIFWDEVALLPNVKVFPYSCSSAEAMLQKIGEDFCLSLSPLPGERLEKCNVSLDDGIVEKMIRLHPFLLRDRPRYSDQEFFHLVKLFS